MDQPVIAGIAIAGEQPLKCKCRMLRTVDHLPSKCQTPDIEVHCFHHSFNIGADRSVVEGESYHNCPVSNSLARGCFNSMLVGLPVYPGQVFRPRNE